MTSPSAVGQSAAAEDAGPIPARTVTLRRAAGAPLGLWVLLAGVVGFVALHVAPWVTGQSSAVSPIRLTISEYQLTPLRAVFDASVLLVAAGAALVFRAAVDAGVVGAGAVSVAAGGIGAVGAGATGAVGGRGRAVRLLTAALAVLAVLGLIGVVAFTKQDWSLPPGLTGSLHRAASLVAFTALPLAVLAGVFAVGPRPLRRGSAGRGWVTAAMVFAVAGLAHFTPILVAIAVHGMRGGWWAAVPLGLVERGMAVCEVMAVACLGICALRRKLLVTP